MTDVGTSMDASGLVFSDNLAVTGSGGALAAGPGTSVQLQSITCSGDSAGRNGGAIALVRVSKAACSNFSIKGGAAKSYGGGLSALGVPKLQLLSTTIETTTAGLGGGGVYLSDVGESVVDDLNIKVSGPVPASFSSGSASKRRKLQSASVVAASSAQCTAAAGASAGTGPPGGGLYVSGASTVAVARSTITVGPFAVGWKGQGLAMELDQRSVCNNTAANYTGSTNNSTCNAVALLETRFVAPAGWEPGPLDRPLFASSLAGWSAACTGLTPSNDTLCPDQSSECATAPSALSGAPALSSFAMLEQLRSGAASKPQASDLQSCLGGSLAGASTQLTSILLLPPVALGLTYLSINNSRTMGQDASLSPAIFPDSNSTFTLGVQLLDESGQRVTGM